MQFNYKTQELSSKGVDFNAIYPDKQDTVKQMTGYDFNLASIVSFLKEETSDYEKQTPLALDIDKHIYSIYLKWAGSKPTEEKPAEEKQEQGEAQQEAKADSSDSTESEEKSTETVEEKPVEQPSKKTLETRLKIVKAMIKEDPENSVLKTRIKIIEKKLKEAK